MPEHISRRDVIVGAGAGLGALTVGSGTAGAAGTGEYNVGTESPAAERAARAAADRVERVLDWGGGEKTITATYPDEAIDPLRNRPGVRYVEENGTMRAVGQTLTWGVDRIDAEVAHANDSDGDGNPETGDGASIAIIDTGIDDDHPDLKANIDVENSTAFVDCEPTPRGGCRFGISPNDNPCNEHLWNDDNDHGTHVAGSAAAIDNSSDVVGVAPDAELIAVKVLDACGSGSYSDVAAGIRHAANESADVANMSLGGDKSQAVADAVGYADEKDVLLVAASGNDGPCSDCVGYPAAEPEVIAVSASTKNDQIADFSSTGPEVDLTAPGKNVLSTVPPESDSDGLATFSGTSMASPHVAGAGALLMANDLTNKQARDKLKNTAEDLGPPSHKQGNGLVDAAAALGLDTGDDYNITVKTNDATNVGSTSATLNGNLDELYNDEPHNFTADVGFQYREDGASTWIQTGLTNKSSTGTYELNVDSLNSGTDYEFRAVAENPNDGDTVIDDTGATLTFTTDSGDGGGGGGDTAPTVDNLSLTEDNSGGSPHADFDASWEVRDEDGDLDTVDLTLTDTTADGETEDSASVDVSGSSASGTTSLAAKHEENSGHEYKVEVVVTDSNGNTASDTATEVEDGS